MEKEIPQEKIYHVVHREQCGQELYNHALWAGGLFETGGTMCYTAQTVPNKNGGTYLYARPVIAFTDNNEAGVKKLRELFGGIVRNKRDTKNSWEWLLQGNKAIPLALAVQPFTPSRHEFMTLAKQWENMTAAERYEAVKDTNNKRAILTVDVYTALVQQPAFVAGIVDSRGIIHKQRMKDAYSDYHYMEIPTNNLALLESLQNTFGGSIQVQRGSPVSENKSFLLKLSYRAARTLYEFVRPHLLLRAEQAAQVFPEMQP